MTIDEVISYEKKCSERSDTFVGYTTEDHEQLAEWLEELEQYRAIGTVEDCRVALEKQVPKKATFDNEDGWEAYICSNCGKTVGEHQKYCWNCGQSFET